MKTVDFSETIAASDLKVGKCRQLIEFMKVCEYWSVLKVKVISLPYIFQVLYVLCFTRPTSGERLQAFGLVVFSSSGVHGYHLT